MGFSSDKLLNLGLRNESSSFNPTLQRAVEFRKSTGDGTGYWLNLNPAYYDRPTNSMGVAQFWAWGASLGRLENEYFPFFNS